MDKIYLYCQHTEENKKLTYSCLSIGDKTYLLVCQSCYVDLQNYFIAQWLGMLINDKLQDVVEGLKLR